MRKRYYLILILAVSIIFGFMYLDRMETDGIVLYLTGDKQEKITPYISIRMDQSTNKVSLWQSEEDGKSYFFLPSCVRNQTVMLGELGGSSVRIDGQMYGSGDLFSWEEDREYQVQITGDAYGEEYTYALIFMKSENIPAIFINTESGNIGYLHGDKTNKDTGDICVVREDGSTEYRGYLERISGRGNSTWAHAKKPYTIKLKEKFPLCGLDTGNKWCLLALWREGSKMDNKIAMDIAEELRLPYSVQGTWVDLYLNGEYAGNYLLTESVSVGEGRVDIYNLEKENKRYNRDIAGAAAYEKEDNKGYLIESGDNISGGYLIEKEHPDEYETEAGSGFVTSAGNLFAVDAPKHASEEQVRYIKDHVENIEQMAQNGQREVWEYLDLDSFVKMFLIDEISLDIDAATKSVYLYKERDDDKLYSGPAWDFDNAFSDGESNRDGRMGYDYEYSILEDCMALPGRLQWYAALYDTPEMKQRVSTEFVDLLPFFEEILNDRIDGYAEMISDSVSMDRVRWGKEILQDNFRGKCEDYYANIKYLKYFLAKRLNWLCARWGADHEAFETPSSGEMHTITFANYEGVVGIMEIMDGAELENPLEYDESVYQGWINQYSGEIYRSKIPVYEDIVLYNPRW